MRPFNQFYAILIIILFAITSCNLSEDPGPIQYNEEVYTVSDFNRLDIGDAMHVTVVKGTFFEINAKGDRRNLDDLEVSKVGNTLVARFTKNRNRRHTTYITISMPELVGANFYGATTATVGGFDIDEFSVNLSGASYAQVDIGAIIIKVNLSGASNLTLAGSSEKVISDVSGASLLKAYSMDAEDFTVTASGASHAYVKASRTLVAEASGASSILYRGEAVVTSKASGGSTILKD